MKKKLALVMFLAASTALMLGCAGMQRPTESNFKPPVVTLEMFQVPQYDGYWYYAGGVKPTKGEPGDRGAPLPLSFLFNVQNPNPYPVLLESMRFTVAFDKEFEVITVNVQDDYWIPEGKTDQVRVTSLITVRSALLSLMDTGGFKLQEKGWSPWEALERWWEGVPNASVPVTVKDGSVSFRADGVSKVIPLHAEFP